jgi:hypothetical protein
VEVEVALFFNLAALAVQALFFFDMPFLLQP